MSVNGIESIGGFSPLVTPALDGATGVRGGDATSGVDSGFGKLVVVLLSLTLLGNTCGTFYAITLSLQTLAPWLVRVPRYVFSVLVTAVVIPVAIKAVDNFSYLRIYEAGHEVPYYQPEASLQVFVQMMRDGGIKST